MDDDFNVWHRHLRRSGFVSLWWCQSQQSRFLMHRDMLFLGNMLMFICRLTETQSWAFFYAAGVLNAIFINTLQITHNRTINLYFICNRVTWSMLIWAKFFMSDFTPASAAILWRSICRCSPSESLNDFSPTVEVRPISCRELPSCC